jgi:hypothetical protein
VPIVNTRQQAAKLFGQDIRPVLAEVTELRNRVLSRRDPAVLAAGRLYEARRHRARRAELLRRLSP